MEKFIVKKGKKEFATLTYSKRKDEWGMKINKKLDLTVCPAFIYTLATNNKYNIDNETTLRFVRERIVPASRQNMPQILKAYGLEKYTEFDALRLGNGKCSMDDCVVKYVK